MTELNEADGLAAEYVVGTLDVDERAAVALRRRGGDSVLDALIRGWERRLAPLTDIAPPVEPTPGLFSAIMVRIGRTQAQVRSNVVALDLSRKVQRWRTVATAFGAVAASLAVFIVVREVTSLYVADPELAGTYVAVLQKDAASPAFLLTIDLKSQKLFVRPVAASPLENKSYELWLVHDSEPAPRSLGVISDAEFSEPEGLAAYDQAVVMNATYAVSLEPKGGSPTGKPTEVVFAGKITQATR